MKTRWLILILLGFVRCTPTENEEENKELVRYFFEDMLAKGDLSEYKARRTTDFVCHSPDGEFGLDQDYHNALQVQREMKGYRVTILNLICENDLVAVHWQAENEKEVGTGMCLFRVRDGKLAEEWPTLPHFKNK